MSYCIIACSVFRDALSWLGFDRKYSNTSIDYLPAYLHLQPVELKKRLVGKLHQHRSSDCRLCCLYGLCFPDIDEVLEEFDVPRLHCNHCFETLLGVDRYKNLIKDRPGTFFLEKELLLNFDAYCWIPLELDDPQLREWYFKYYRHMVYIRQPLDPDLTNKAGQIADRLNLSLQVADADYLELRIALTRLLQDISST